MTQKNTFEHNSQIQRTTHKMGHKANNTDYISHPLRHQSANCQQSGSDGNVNARSPSKPSSLSSQSIATRTTATATTQKSIATITAPVPAPAAAATKPSHDHRRGRYSNALVAHSSASCKSSLLSMAVILLALIVLIAVASDMASANSSIRQTHPEAKGIFKRSFAGLGCLGVYDRAKFARLDRICEECYQLYREPEIHTACRQECFRNSVFNRCIDALLLTHEAKKISEMVDELYGK